MRFQVILMGAVALAACDLVEVEAQKVRPSPTMIEAAKTAIEDDLRDPASARYRNLSAYNIGAGETLLCGEVNAKNGFGGYAGFGVFEATFNSAGQMENLVVDALNGGPYASLTCEAANNGTYFRQSE